MERTVTAEYELEYLLLEGHCFDTVTQQPPRGLQFTLGTKNTPVVVDTIVMASLVSITRNRLYLITRFGEILLSFPDNKMKSILSCHCSTAPRKQN